MGEAKDKLCAFCKERYVFTVKEIPICNKCYWGTE